MGVFPWIGYADSYRYEERDTQLFGIRSAPGGVHCSMAGVRRRRRGHRSDRHGLVGLSAGSGGIQDDWQRVVGDASEHVDGRRLGAHRHAWRGILRHRQQPGSDTRVSACGRRQLSHLPDRCGMLRAFELEHWRLVGLSLQFQQPPLRHRRCRFRFLQRIRSV